MSSLKSFPSFWVYLRFDRESGLVRRGSNPALVVVNFHAELIFCSVSFFKAEAGNADEHTTCDAGEMTDFSFFGRLPTPSLGSVWPLCSSERNFSGIPSSVVVAAVAPEVVCSPFLGFLEEGFFFFPLLPIVSGIGGVGVGDFSFAVLSLVLLSFLLSTGMNSPFSSSFPLIASKLFN